METNRKRISVWLIVLATISFCALAVIFYGRYTIVYEREPAWSPDGSKLAYQSNYLHVRILDLETGEEYPLINRNE
jgi:hypothetical protein